MTCIQLKIITVPSLVYVSSSSIAYVFVDVDYRLSTELPIPSLKFKRSLINYQCYLYILMTESIKLGGGIE